MSRDPTQNRPGAAVRAWWLAFSAIALAASSAACAPSPTPRRAEPAPRGTSASATASSADASEPPVATPPVSRGPHGASLTEIAGPEVLGRTEIGFSLFTIDDGLLVVRNVPAAGFLVTGSALAPLPGYFDGLHTPVREWDALDFTVDGAHGKLSDLAFTMGAPSSGELREVRGTTRHWKVGKSTPKAPVWLAEDVVSLPVTLPSGARIFERASTYQGEASAGFRFELDGPAKGDKLPVPAPGADGCKYAVLGHPFLEVLPDGTLLGIGTACERGSDVVTTAKLDGVGWPYQALVPRIGTGALVAEIWSGGQSRVLPLPGAERVADFSAVALSVKDARDVVVLAQVPGSGDGRAYVAELDGTAFRDVTPPNPPSWLEPFRTRDGTLLLFGDQGAFRRTLAGWDRIRYETEGDDDPCVGAAPHRFAEAPGEAAVYLGAFGRCLWRLPHGGDTAERVALPADAMLQQLAVFDGALFILVGRGESASLYRAAPPR